VDYRDKPGNDEWFFCEAANGCAVRGRQFSGISASMMYGGVHAYISMSLSVKG